MSRGKKVNITVYGKDYSIVSSEDESKTREYAEYIDNLMRTISQQTGAMESGRVAVLAMLQMAHELFTLREKSGIDDMELERRIEKLIVDMESGMSESGIQTKITTDNG